MKYFGGCDVGSTYTKAVILDENGKMCADTTIRSKINAEQSAIAAMQEVCDKVGLKDSKELAYADAAEQCRTAVVQRQKRVAEGDDLQILHARVQHVGINRAVEQPDHRAGQHKAYHADHHTGQAAEQQQLTGAFVGIPALFCAQILAYHHRTAGSQRRKQHDDKVIDHIHQTDAGDGRLAAAGHHHGVGHAHRHFQQLLHQQRNGQHQQFLLAEQRLPPAVQPVFFIAMQ